MNWSRPPPPPPWLQDYSASWNFTLTWQSKGCIRDLSVSGKEDRTDACGRCFEAG